MQKEVEESKKEKIRMSLK